MGGAGTTKHSIQKVSHYSKRIPSIVGRLAVENAKGFPENEPAREMGLGTTSLAVGVFGTLVGRRIREQVADFPNQAKHNGVSVRTAPRAGYEGTHLPAKGTLAETTASTTSTGRGLVEA